MNCWCHHEFLEWVAVLGVITFSSVVLLVVHASIATRLASKQRTERDKPGD